jgi:hypothetical protein
MRLLNRFEQGNLRLTRIEAFVVYLLTPLFFVVPPSGGD